MNPNQDILRRKALLAAASVVLALGAGGCAPSPSGGSADDSAAPSTDTSADTSEVDNACNDLSAEETSTCCEARREACDAEFGEGTDAADECIFGADFSGSTGCIPWGPPVPPVFRA